jgi:hypothetical protein
MDENTEQSLLSEHGSQNRAWVELETSREVRHWLPWRPDLDRGESSAEDCEDPERVILFDDISSALFYVDSEANRYRMITGFLKFLVGDETDSRTIFFEWDILLRSLPNSMENCHYALQMNSISMELWQKVSDVLQLSNSESSSTDAKIPESLPKYLCDFVENGFEQLIQVCHDDFRTLLTVRYIRFKMINFMRRRQDSSQQEFRRASKELRKFFKTLLKLEPNRNCLPIWECFALFEWEAENVEEARKVLETAISIAGPDVTKTTVEDISSCLVMRLYSTYIRLEFGFSSGFSNQTSVGCFNKFRSSSGVRKPNIGRCLRVLTMICEGKLTSISGDLPESLSPATEVRARRMYQQRFDILVDSLTDAISSASSSVARISSMLLDWTFCYAIFLFVTAGLSSSIELYQKLLARLQGSCISDSNFSQSANDITISSSQLEGGRRLPCSDSVAWENKTELPTSVNDARLTFSGFCRRVFVEQSTKLFISFLHHNQCINPTPLRMLREPLSRALTQFPNDCQLLDIFLDVETAGCSIGRIREYFHKALAEAVTPVPFIYAILAEKKRMQKLASSSLAYSRSSSVSGM